MSHSTQQMLVDQRFHGEAQQWSELYEQPGLTPDIYRLRRDRTLAAIHHEALPGARVLEVGCGTGVVSVKLAEEGYHVVATDRLEAMIQFTRDRAESAGLHGRITTKICDAYRVPFPSGSFDIVLAVGVLPWLRLPCKALQELARVLSGSGRLIITSDNRWALTTVFDPLCSPVTKPGRRAARFVLEELNFIASSEKPVLHLHSSREIDNFLSHAGLEKVSGMTIGFGPFVFLKHRIFPEHLSMRLHATLQGLADGGVPFIRSMGIEYLAIARKSITGLEPSKQLDQASRSSA